MARGLRTVAFTLVELLVVIAIISTLAALLLPALEHGLTQARIVACINTQKQFALSMTMYTGDHDNRVPPSYNFINGEFVWSSLMRSYPSNVWYRYSATPAYHMALRAGYLWPSYSDGQTFYCPDYKIAGGTPQAFDNSGGWARVSAPTSTGSARTNFLFLAMNDAFTRGLRDNPWPHQGDFRNYFNLFGVGRMVRPHVHENLKMPMIWEDGGSSVGNLNAGWRRAHDWQVCNVAYWDGSVISRSDARAFLTEISLTGEAPSFVHRFWIDRIKR